LCSRRLFSQSCTERKRKKSFEVFRFEIGDEEGEVSGELKDGGSRQPTDLGVLGVEGIECGENIGRLLGEVSTLRGDTS
jgi:hypothetical protein